ncbi:MAG: hypothetical protein JST66_00330 [Bacteroidetes bacterium]|nr:hypothetical protein [Bacteroidota bacterium]
MKAALIAAMVCPAWLPFSNAGKALAQTTYYVNEAFGNDVTGTGAIGAPFQTIGRLMTAVSGSVPSNTTVRLAKNGTYPGTITVAGGATNVTIGPYNSGTSPIITGSDPVTLGSPTGNIYQASIPNGVIVGHIYKNGILQTLARYPNVDDPDNGWLRNQQFTQNVTVGGNTYDQLEGTVAVPVTPDPIGATIVVRATNWSYERSEVLDVLPSPSALLLPDNSPLDLQGYHWGYFLENKYDFLDQNGEWYFDPGTGSGGTLYFYWDGGSAPTGVRMAVRDAGIAMGSPSTKQTIFIGDIVFEHQTGAAITTNYCNGLTVVGCTFRDLYQGINNDAAGTNTNNTFTGNTFTDIYDRAIRTSAANATISSSTFENIGIIPGLGEDNWGYQGVNSSGTNCTIQYNRFINIGYTAIGLAGSGLVRNNYIRNGLAILNDGGGIALDMSDGLTIENNVIAGLGDPDVNLISSADNYSAYHPISYGIYFGDRSIKHTTVRGNTVTGCAAGIHVDHSLESEDALVEDNILFGNDIQLSMTDYSNYKQWTVGMTTYGGDNDPISDQGAGNGNTPNYKASYDDTYDNNILYCLREDQVCMRQGHIWPGDNTELVDFGDFTSNHYFNPFSDVPILQEVKYAVSGVTNELGPRAIPWSLEGWQAMSSQDATANESPFHLRDYSVVTTGSLESALSDDFNGGVTGWTPSVSCPPSGLSLGGGDNALRSTDCAWIEKGCCYQYIGAGGTPSLAAGLYKFNFKARSADTDALRLDPVYDAGTKFRGPKYLALGSGWRDYEFVIEATDEGANDFLFTAFQNVQFSLGALSTSTVDLNDVEVRPCTIDPDHGDVIAAEHILRYNLTGAGVTGDPNSVASFELEGCWSDVFGTIHTGTVTLDPWESIVLYRLDTHYDMDGNFNITGTETWNSDRSVRGAVVVKSGGYLTVDGATIGFADSRQCGVPTYLKVEKGGRLDIVNGGTLTSVPICGNKSMWDGVRVEGVPITSSSSGLVYMRSGGTISNALTGLLAGTADPMAPGYTNTTAGIRNGLIDAKGAFFTNNLHDVVILGLPATSFGAHYFDIPFFQEVEFKTTAHLNYADLDPVVHVRVSEHGQTKFYGCTFANDIGEHEESLRMGQGLELFNSNASVWPTHTANTGIFRNLDHGIHAVNPGGSPYTNVVEHTFTDNICGAYLADVVSFGLLDNTFEIGRWLDVLFTNPDETFWDGFHRGIFTTGGYGFDIRDNDLMATPSLQEWAPREGIVVGYTRDHNDIVEKNAANDLDRAFGGEGVCVDVTDPDIVGLQFHCNTNLNNITDLFSRTVAADVNGTDDHTIRGHQAAASFMAGNTFDNASGNLDFEIEPGATPLLSTISYYHHPVAANETPVYYTNAGATVLVPVANAPEVPSACDPFFEGGEEGFRSGEGGDERAALRAALVEQRAAYDAARAHYAALIDDGDTEAMIQAISTAGPADMAALRTTLLAQSPYLSTEALKAVVEQPWMADLAKAEVLVADPEATSRKGFLAWSTGEAALPITDSTEAAVLASWASPTERATLEDELGTLHTRLTRSVGRLVRLYRMDTVPVPADTVIAAWRYLPTKGARYAEAALLMGEGRYAEARDVVDDMDAELAMAATDLAEQARMLAYLDVLATAQAEERDSHHLDSTEVQALLDMVGEHYDRPANWASNLLCAVYHHCRPPYTGGGGRAEQRSMPAVPPRAAAVADRFSAVPNPAQHQVTFTYALSGTPNASGTIRIRDGLGRLLAMLPMTGQQGQSSYTVDGLPAGVYLVEYAPASGAGYTEKLMVRP